VFGSAPHVERPDGCTLAKYVYSIPTEVMEQDIRFRKNPAGHMKSIVNTKFSSIDCNPHTCVSTRPYVLADGTLFSNIAAEKLQYDRAYVHHYITRYVLVCNLQVYQFWKGCWVDLAFVDLTCVHMPLGPGCIMHAVAGG
jgi:hypothetical protein